MPMRSQQRPWSVGACLAWSLAACSALAPGLAQAQDTAAYRCGNTYQSKPCPGGVPVDVADPRSAEQRRDAQAAAKRDEALARRMAQDRQAAEREARRQGGAVNVGPRAAPAPAKPASAAKAQKKHKTLKTKPAAPAQNKAAVKPTSG